MLLGQKLVNSLQNNYIRVKQVKYIGARWQHIRVLRQVFKTKAHVNLFQKRERHSPLLARVVKTEVVAK